MVPPRDGQWGTLRPNGTWSGLIGHSAHGHTNISLGMLSATSERSQAVDFSIPFYFDSLSSVAPLPKDLPKYFAIVKPFLAYTWMLVALFAFLSGPTYWLTLQSSEKREGFVSMCVYCISLLLRNPTIGKLELPCKSSQKVFLFTWLIFCFLISAAYTGNLISFLTYPGKEKEINSAEDIIKSGYNVEGVDYGGTEAQFYATNSEPNNLRIFEKMRHVSSPKASMERVLQGNTVLIDFFTSIIPNVKVKYVSRRGQTKVHIGKQPFMTSLSVWAYQPDAVFKSAFDQSLQWLLAFGFPKKWEDMAVVKMKKMIEKGNLKENEIASNIKLSLENMQVFIVKHKVFALLTKL